MGMMKHFLDETAAEMGQTDPNNPMVVAEAQRRLDAMEQSRQGLPRSLGVRLAGITVTAFCGARPASAVLKAMSDEEIAEALEQVLEDLMHREVKIPQL